MKDWLRLRILHCRKQGSALGVGAGTGSAHWRPFSVIDRITGRGARQHKLKNVAVDIPLNVLEYVVRRQEAGEEPNQKSENGNQPGSESRPLSSRDRIMILAPVVRGRKGEFKKLFEGLAAQGFVRARVDGQLRQLDEEIQLDRRRNHTIEVVVDRLLVKPGIESRLSSSIETAMKLANGIVQVAVVNGE